MIIVKIELHSAVTGKVTEIGRMKIINCGTTNTPTRGNYSVSLMRRNTERTVQRHGAVIDHPRLSQSIWRLVAKALVSVGVTAGRVDRDDRLPSEADIKL